VATASDNFDRANGATGSNWTVYENMAGGGGQIVSMAWGPAQAFDWREGQFWNATDFGEDQYSQARKVTTGTHIAVAVRCKVGTSTRGYYYAWFNTGVIEKGENGTVTTLTTTSTYTAADTVKLQVVGNVLTFYKNGASVGTYTDTGTPLPSGGQPGLLSINMGDGARMDDWEGGDVGGAAAIISTPSFAQQNTTTSNDLADDGYTWASQTPLIRDSFGKLIIWAEKYNSNNTRHRPVVSNDGGTTWSDPTISGFFDSGGEGFLNRCACAWDSIHDLLHCLWQATDSGDGFIYRRYAITRDGSNNITAVTRVSGVSLQLDYQLGGQNVFLGHPNLIWQPIGTHGQILCVWGVHNDAAALRGAELRGSMRVLSNTTADNTAANWKAPVAADTDTIGNPPQVPYSILAVRAGFGTVPNAGLLLKAAGTHVGDVYIGGHDGNSTSSGGAWKLRRMVWDAANSDWSNTLGAVVTFDNVLVAGTDGGYTLKYQIGSQLTEDVINDRVYMAYPVWLDNTAGDTVCLRYASNADTASSRVVVYSVGGAHAFAPTVDAVADPTTGKVVVVYEKNDKFIYAQVFDGVTQAQAETTVFTTAAVDIPLLWRGGRTSTDKLLVKFRDHVTVPYKGYFGTMTWAGAVVTGGKPAHYYQQQRRR